MAFQRFSGNEHYIVSPELSDAVNVAIALEKPLLVRGEPGTGKTVLAEAIADSLVMELITWNIKSTTEGQDGLYLYDTVARLNDARFGDRDISDVSAYIKFGPLGRSFLSDQRVVLLIDEVDKADMEFPNDLLHEIDRMSFSVEETNESHTATHRPIVIITSNAEKELPDAFLRRCVFHYIEFPEKELMEDIVRVHHPDIEDELLRQVLVRFYWLRDLPDLRKRPSTSELIDWIAALRRGGVDAESIENELPFLGVLLKREADTNLASTAQRRSRVN
ncbi:MAG: MoxR family ATPase [Acidobacteriota bacterium]|nr:MoxR family ATPase [Acidobacteriota bacterium]